MQRHAILLALVLPLIATSCGVAATITVAKSGGDYSTISEAMKAAKAGDTVLVKRGSYRETVRLKEGVTLKGEKRDDCVIVGLNDHAVVIRGLKAAAVKDLTLRYSAGPRRRGTKPRERSTLYIYNSTATVEGCLVERATGSGIMVVGSKSKVTIRGNTCRKNQWRGIMFLRGASGTIEGNICKNNGASGIGVHERGTTAVVRDNLCANNGWNGVFFAFCDGGALEKNTCEENRYHGISLRNVRGKIEMSVNGCRKNKVCGILVTESGRVLVEDNTCKENKTGIQLQTKGTVATVRRNTCSKHEGIGIVVMSGATGTIRGNTCEENEHGILLFESAGLVEGNTCSKNEYQGIKLKATLAKTIVRNNLCARNKGSGIRLMAGALGLVEGNICPRNGYNGIVALDDGTAPLVRNNICFENVESGILAFDGAAPKVTLNIVIRNDQGISNGDVIGHAEGNLVNVGYNCVWNNSVEYILSYPPGTDMRVDPGLVRKKDGSYALMKGSPLIGAGPKGENIGGLDVARDQ